MKFEDIKRGMDKNAAYFWQNRNGRFALVNAFTLKTVTGVSCRLDAIKLTNSLASAGYSIAKLEDYMPS